MTLFQLRAALLRERRAWKHIERAARTESLRREARKHGESCARQARAIAAELDRIG